jgi:predicted metal-dependent phosphotriesterase family hydrolase
VAKVETVLGPVDAGALGPTLSHVHLTLDILCWYMEPPDPALRALAAKPLCLENLGLARRNGLMVRDNLVQNDVELTIRELSSWRARRQDRDRHGAARHRPRRRRAAAIARATG